MQSTIKTIFLKQFRKQQTNIKGAKVQKQKKTTKTKNREGSSRFSTGRGTGGAIMFRCQDINRWNRQKQDESSQFSWYIITGKTTMS